MLKWIDAFDDSFSADNIFYKNQRTINWYYMARKNPQKFSLSLSLFVSSHYICQLPYIS